MRGEGVPRDPRGPRCDPESPRVAEFMKYPLAIIKALEH